MDQSNRHPQVMLVERPLSSGPSNDAPANSIYKRASTSTIPDVTEEFLRKQKTAKILFIINTHYLKNGCFVYQDDSPTEYKACTLFDVGTSWYQALLYSSHPLQIVRDCSPLGIFKYLSSKEERVHAHRSLVLNLVCGALVAQVGA